MPGARWAGRWSISRHERRTPPVLLKSIALHNALASKECPESLSAPAVERRHGQVHHCLVASPTYRRPGIKGVLEAVIGLGHGSIMV